jgi:hypothetical protein
MKLFLTILLFLSISLVSIGQKANIFHSDTIYGDKFYSGIYAYNHHNHHISPYIYYRFFYRDNTEKSKNILIYSTIGFGVNSYGKLNFSVGQDLVINEKILIGPGISFFGYKEIGQFYLPELRIGYKLKKYMLIGTSYWNYKNAKVSYDGVNFGIGKQPIVKFTIGCFRTF